MSSLWKANKNIGVVYAKFNKTIILPLMTALFGIIGIGLFIVGITNKEKTLCNIDSDCAGDDNKCNDTVCSKTKTNTPLIIIGAILIVIAPLIYIGGRWWANYEIRNPGVAAAALDMDIASRIL